MFYVQFKYRYTFAGHLYKYINECLESRLDFMHNVETKLNLVSKTPISKQENFAKTCFDLPKPRNFDQTNL